MGKIKTNRKLFRQWQRDSLRHVTSTPSTETHHCHCCENDYTGNYCPTCGQRAGAKHLTWNSVRSGIMDVWGVGSRSLPYTLLQLLLRPGYLIADYINGRRQVSFPPVKMLVIVALLVFLLNSLINPDDFTTTNDNTEFKLYFRFLNWLSHHYDWAAMFFCSFLIIPTHLIFRHSPCCSHHTLPEGFFIQVFNATQIIIITILPVVIGAFMKGDPDWYYIVWGIIILLFIYRSYLQLFGYGYWGTLWRLAMVLVAGFMMMTIILILSFSIHLTTEHSWIRLKQLLLVNLPKYLLLMAAPMLLSAWINKRHAKGKHTHDGDHC